MSEVAPPDWYPDPFGRHQFRYWDGAAWSAQVASHGHVATDPPQGGLPEDRSRGAPANWYPDPRGRYETRFWDGERWTQHVASGGQACLDHAAGALAAPGITAPVPRRPAAPTGLAQQGSWGFVPLLQQPVLVVNQKARLFSGKAEYEIRDQRGAKIGVVQELDHHLMQRAVGLAGENRRHRFQVCDHTGQILLTLYRPATILKSTMLVSGANGVRGTIRQRSLGILTKVHFSLESDGIVLGSINAEDRRKWDFDIRDASGIGIGSVTKTWAGWAKERFTKADNYVVQVSPAVQDPLRSLVIAAAVAIDTALKQGQPTSGKGRRRRYQ